MARARRDRSEREAGRACRHDPLRSRRRNAVTHNLVVKPKSFPTRRLTVDDAFVNPPPAVTKRIEDEAARLSGHLGRRRRRNGCGTDSFVRPVPQEANSRFGSRSILNGQAMSPHGGADFASPEGTPIKAPNAGRVVLADDLYYTGGTVVIDHGLGLVSLFAHLSRVDVREGQMVERGASSDSSAPPDGSRAHTSIGPCVPTARGSIRSRCWRYWGRHEPSFETPHLRTFEPPAHFTAS